MPAITTHGLVTTRSHKPAASAPRVPALGRISGLGSVFGKTLRDSRLAMLAVAALLGLMAVAGGGSMATSYGTLETRLELAAMSRDMPPMMRGMYGDPVNVDTLGGFISWHYGAYFALIAGLWSILALSSILAGEARRGSLEFVATTPHGRRSVALQKVAGHAAAVTLAMAIVAIAVWATGVAFARLPGDEISPAAAISFAIGIGLRGLIAGSVAFALAALLGRGAAAGIAGAVMLGGYVLHGYRTIVPAFETVSRATWYAWSGGHIPLAGRDAWPGLALVVLVCAALLVLGIEGFARRDVGARISVPIPALPGPLLGVRGPFSRTFGEQLPAALAWGVGLGVYGVLMAAASSSLLGLLTSTPSLAQVFRTLIPGIDLTTAAGFLQLAFADLGFVLIGIAAATFVAIGVSDETSGRLELLFATPLSRARWALASGVASWLAVVVVAILLGVAVAAGVAGVGQDPVTPASGIFVLAIYGVAVAGIGVGVGGIFGSAFAAPTVLAVVIGTFLLDVLAPLLRLPEWVAQLALTTHLGQPMIGSLDGPGMLACLALAAGGLAAGAWGIARRDIRG